MPSIVVLHAKLPHLPLVRLSEEPLALFREPQIPLCRNLGKQKLLETPRRRACSNLQVQESGWRSHQWRCSDFPIGRSCSEARFRVDVQESWSQANLNLGL